MPNLTQLAQLAHSGVIQSLSNAPSQLRHDLAQFGAVSRSMCHILAQLLQICAIFWHGLAQLWHSCPLTVPRMGRRMAQFSGFCMTLAAGLALPPKNKVAPSFSLSGCSNQSSFDQLIEVTLD